MRRFLRSGIIAVSCGLAFCCAVSLHAQTVLIDKYTSNGSFEDGKLGSWNVFQDDAPVNKVEKDKSKASDGEAVYHILTKGGAANGHNWDVISQDISVDAANGTTLALAMDLQSNGEHPELRAVAQVYFLNAQGGPAVSVVSLGETPIKTTWTRWTPATVEFPDSWTGGRIQIRIGTLIRKGNADTTYEAWIDNVTLIRGQKVPTTGTADGRDKK